MKLLAVLAIGLAPLAAQAQAPTQETRMAGTRLDIAATGESRRTPDIANVTAGVVTQAGTAARAMTDNAARMTATLAALRQAGIANRDIRTESIRLSPQYRYADNQPPVPTGYQASNSVSVRLRDLTGAGAVLDALVAAGANQIEGPELSVDHPEAALDEARTAALAIARARADLYAKAAGLRVVRIVRIGEESGGGPAARPMAMMATGGKRAATPVEAGEETLAVTLQVTFELQ